MDEEASLSHLEYALCDHLRENGAWCDGFLATRSFQTSRSTFVEGEVWLMDVADDAGSWRFELRVNEPVAPGADWEELEATFDVDFAKRRVFVSCGRAGTALPPNTQDPIQDVLDYFEAKRIPAVLLEDEAQPVVVASISQATRVFQQGEGWVAENELGSMLFSTWREAVDYLALLRDEPE